LPLHEIKSVLGKRNGLRGLTKALEDEASQTRKAVAVLQIPGTVVLSDLVQMELDPIHEAEHSICQPLRNAVGRGVKEGFIVFPEMNVLEFRDQKKDGLKDEGISFMDGHRYKSIRVIVIPVRKVKILHVQRIEKSIKMSPFFFMLFCFDVRGLKVAWYSSKIIKFF